jgi:hypothetical protein
LHASELTTSQPTTAGLTEPETPEATEAPFISAEVAVIAVVEVACIIRLVSFWASRKRK